MLAGDSEYIRPKRQPTYSKRAALIKDQIERLNKELSAIVDSPTSSRTAPRTNRAMSASAKKKIAAAQKARWANLRRAKPAISSAKPAAKAEKKTMSQQLDESSQRN